MTYQSLVNEVANKYKYEKEFYKAFCKNYCFLNMLDPMDKKLDCCACYAFLDESIVFDIINVGVDNG